MKFKFKKELEKARNELIQSGILAPYHHYDDMESLPSITVMLKPNALGRLTPFVEIDNKKTIVQRKYLIALGSILIYCEYEEYDGDWGNGPGRNDVIYTSYQVYHGYDISDIKGNSDWRSGAYSVLKTYKKYRVDKIVKK